VEAARHLVTRRANGTIWSPLDLAVPLTQQLALTADGVLDGNQKRLTLVRKQIAELGALLMSCQIGHRYHTAALERAATHPGLGQYDASTQSTKPSPLQMACVRILTSLRHLESQDEYYGRVRTQFFEEATGSRNAHSWHFTGSRVASALGAGLRFSQALSEILNLYRHITFGVDLDVTPTSRIPHSPFVDTPDGGLVDYPDAEQFRAWAESTKRSGAP
jgi:hypothetical protein